MSFLAPYMLWGALAGAVPILIHLFFRSRYRRIPWAAMKFLLVSLEQTSRRLKFQELLLLLARVALLVLVALAFSRPSSLLGGGGGAGDPVDAVLVIDNSLSMDAREGEKTRLERARSAALDVLDQLPPHSTVQVIAAADRALVLGPHNPGDLDAARESIKNLPQSQLATDFLPAAIEAAGILTRGQAPVKEFFLFSDMHKLGWEQQGPALKTRLQEIGHKATIFLVRCGTQMPLNAGVIGIVSPSGIPHTGERPGFAVLVRNSGTTPLRNLLVSLAVDGNPALRESQPVPELNPGETRTVTLTCLLDRPGLRTLTATVKTDELDGDNRYDQVIQVRDQVRLLVVDGAVDERRPEKSASFFLEHALLPVKETDRFRYFVQPRRITPFQAAPGLLADKDLCILVNVPLQGGGPAGGNVLSREFLDSLASFVREGHGLIIFAGDRVVPEPYNRLLLQQRGLLPMKLAADQAAGGPARLDRNSVASMSFAKFREDEAYRDLAGIDIRRRLCVEAAGSGETADEEPTQVLLRYSDNRPAVLARRAGGGQTMLVTTAADLSWSDWPLWKGMFLPFVDAALNHLLQDLGQTHNQVAGAPLRWHPREWDAAQPIILIHPDGRRTPLGTPELEKGRPVVTTNDTARAGIYRLGFASGTPGSGGGRGKTLEGIPFAVVPDPRETEDLTSLTDEQLDQRLDFKTIHFTAGSQANVPLVAERLSREWTLWLLGAAILIGLFESAFAWFCNRPR